MPRVFIDEIYWAKPYGAFSIASNVKSAIILLVYWTAKETQMFVQIQFSHSTAKSAIILLVYWTAKETQMFVQIKFSHITAKNSFMITV